MRFSVFFSTPHPNQAVSLSEQPRYINGIQSEPVRTFFEIRAFFTHRESVFSITFSLAVRKELVTIARGVYSV